MICELCHGTKVVSHPLGSYGFTTGPCPNCTDYVHDHYESELEAIVDDKNRSRVIAK
ncbi:hypothetical protein RA086_05490 [Lactiplantibacillus sp. WILCCON 0030]|uniref:Prophage protein n=1 Tax=Lactiplantibacillus brownii TaxID=3069269 RepID=A0ABU1A8V7_9LACO|nr:hypothetical protein [Lactiplantibacillus brownii]MDQ7937080.1 hypothetical protein [Lactiplantibacillus brownii]